MDAACLKMSAGTRLLQALRTVHLRLVHTVDEVIHSSGGGDAAFCQITLDTCCCSSKDPTCIEKVKDSGFCGLIFDSA